jgi:site-specific DNA-methyltransferase (adenine-specific)/modification methylase
MNPYYEHAGITIYHGDCREIAPTLTADALISDPPYGINYVHGDGGGCLAKSTVFAQVPVYGDSTPFNPWPWVNYKRCVLFGANHYAPKLPPSPTWLVWDKRCGLMENDQADCEFAWVKDAGPARIMRHYWNGMLKASEKQEPRVHPTQKPVALMEWVISRYAEINDVILDPYMGSGTTLIAAKKLNHSAIGIEIEEKYCEIAAKRLSQEVFQFESGEKVESQSP